MQENLVQSLCRKAVSDERAFETLICDVSANPAQIIQLERAPADHGKEPVKPSLVVKAHNAIA